MSTPLIPKLKHTNSLNFFLIAGPCVVENESVVMQVAEHMVKITDELKIPYVFKSSFKKANRQQINSFTGIGNELACKLLKKVSDTFNIPVLTDIHETTDAAMAAEYVDVLQIPAFLARQTDLIVAAAQTGKFVNLKKAQFMAPEAMQYAVKKVTDSGNNNVFITDRGSMFGYRDYVVDFTGVPTMQQYAPVVLDVTHSLQIPNAEGGVSGGRPHLIPTLAQAGIGAGVDGLFFETHPNPAEAKSDGANMIPLSKFNELLKKLVAIHEAVRS